MRPLRQKINDGLETKETTRKIQPNQEIKKISQLTVGALTFGQSKR